jgi:WD40 repeat protein
MLAAGLADGSLRIFELARAKNYDLGNGHAARVTALAFSPDGTRLTSAGLDCAVSRWNLLDRYRTEMLIPGGDNPQPILALENPADDMWWVAACPQAVYIFSGGTLLHQITFDHEGKISSTTLSADNQHLAIGGDAVWLSEIDSSGLAGKPVQITGLSHNGPYQVAFLPESDILITAYSQSVAFYSIPDGQEPELLDQIPLPPSVGPLISLNISPQQNLILIGGENGLIHILGIPGRSSGFGSLP